MKSQRIHLITDRKESLWTFEQKSSEEEQVALWQDGQLRSFFLHCDCMDKCTCRQQVWSC